MSKAPPQCFVPLDQKQRQRALNPRQSFIVQAPAGSGKTELLVRRYLKLLAQVEVPEQILAITFTNKATAEMRARVVNAIASVDPLHAPSDASELYQLAVAVRANDAKRGWQLTANTRRLRIQTIDAFCNELVCRMPWSARFGSPPTIVDDPQQLYQRAAQRTLEHLERDGQWASCSQSLLELVEADWNKALNLLTKMLAKRDIWMRVLGTNHAAERADLEAMWQQHLDDELCTAAAAFTSHAQAELTTLGAFAADNLVVANIESPISALHGTKKFPPAKHEFVRQWQALAALLLTKDGQIRKRVTKNEGFPADSSEHKNTKSQMLELLTQLANQPQIAASMGEVRLLPPPEFTDAQWQSLAALMQLLLLATAELKILLKEQNEADYIELTQRAALALGDADAPSDLALVFDAQITHLLMDEFQDTSTAHIALLTRLTAGWQSPDWRTVFFVGDPMQSIYRFREAEVGNFLQVWETQRFGDLVVQRIALQSNFRSAAPLVNWFNDTFRTVLPQKNDPSKSAVKYATTISTQPHPPPRRGKRADKANAATVYLHTGRGEVFARQACPVTANSTAAHATWQAQNDLPGGNDIAELVYQLQQHNPEQSIAILGRTRAHLHAIATTLRQRNLAFQAIDLEKLSDRLAIRDLNSLTRALLQPADRIAWLSLLRAPWCGMRLADIAALTAAEPHKTVFELCEVEALVKNLSVSGKACLQRLRDALAPALQRCGRISLRQNVEASWLALGGPATAHETDLDDCHRYLDLLTQMESEQQQITPATLQQACKNLWAQSGSDAKVQLLTIHKAKGLEFDSVLLPSLERAPRALEKALLRWRNLPQRLLLAPLPSSSESHDAFYRYLLHMDKIHEHNETARLLYVACTRARTQLHLFGATENPTPAAASLLALLWPSVQSQYAPANNPDSTAVAYNSSSTFQPPYTQRLPLHWSPPSLPPTIQTHSPLADHTEPIEFSWAGERARIVGIVVHHILQQIEQPDWQSWCQQSIDEQQKCHWRNLLRQHGITENQLETTLSQVVDALEKMRCDVRAEWIFCRTHRNIKTEWALAGLVDGNVAHIVIDRSFIDQHDTYWIIDFKLSRHQGAEVDAFLHREQQRHQQQMTRYATVLKQLIDDANNAGQKQTVRAIRLGLYFPFLQGWREWDGPILTEANAN